MAKKERTILFVCTGNTCRSSMAAGIAEKMLQELTGDKPEIRILSAGTGAVSGYPASDHAITVMKGKNIDLSGHRSKQLDFSMIREADYIFTMTGRQKAFVLALEPSVSPKTYTIGEFASDGSTAGPGDIIDPFGGSLEIYQACAEELNELISRMLKKIS